MELSKEALQLTIDDMRVKIDNQILAIHEYNEEISRLKEEKFELRLLVTDVESGRNKRYDSNALKNNVNRIDDNIEDFEKAISDMEFKKSDMQKMIATLEVKRDTESF